MCAYFMHNGSLTAALRPLTRVMVARTWGSPIAFRMSHTLATLSSPACGVV